MVTAQTNHYRLDLHSCHPFGGCYRAPNRSSCAIHLDYHSTPEAVCRATACPKQFQLTVVANPPHHYRHLAGAYIQAGNNVSLPHSVPSPGKTQKTPAIGKTCNIISTQQNFSLFSHRF
jgi:hypothetical protein